MSHHPAPTISAETASDLERFGAQFHVRGVDHFDSIEARNTRNAAFAAPLLAMQMRTFNGDMESELKDLISNLMHLADALGFGGGNVAEAAADYYYAELREMG